MTISHYIVGLVGIGYLAVGIQQVIKGNASGAIIWIGYSFSQIGLFHQLAK